MNICKVCVENYINNNNGCELIYDEETLEDLMLKIMWFTYCLIALYVFVAIFKPYLWILVVLVIENIQVIGLLSFTNSLHYRIYAFYSGSL